MAAFAARVQRDGPLQRLLRLLSSDETMRAHLIAALETCIGDAGRW